uniref:Uncharacterized protein n=1 Tax=viral metagenome TaxID=1070528 RepID=A0A2V0RCK6_9ZZZZ
MERDSSKYQGAIPKPNKKQIEDGDVANFEKEELSNELYEKDGLPKTVKEILLDPDKYEIVIKNEQFMQLVKAANLEVGTPAVPKDEPPKDAPPPAEEGTLAVATKPNIPEDHFDEFKDEDMKSEPPRKKSMFDPKLKMVTRPITAPVAVESVKGFLMCKAHGLEDMFEEDLPFNKSWGLRFKEIALPYQSGGTVEPMQSKDGLADTSKHAFVVGPELAPFGASSHERVLSDREVVGYTKTIEDVGMRRNLLSTRLDPGKITNFDSGEGRDVRNVDTVLDLATEERKADSRIIVQSVITNPEYLRILLHSTNLFNKLHLSFNNWCAVHEAAGILDPRHKIYVANQRHFIQRDVLNQSEDIRTVYQVRFFGPPGRNTDDFYYSHHPQEPFDVCFGALERSSALANEEVAHIASRERGTVQIVGNRGSEWVQMLGVVTPAEGSEMARSLVSTLLGGYRSAFTVKPKPEAMNDITASLCAVASLAGMDYNTLMLESRSHLLNTALSPFYYQTSQLCHTMQSGGGGSPVGSITPRISSGTLDIIADFFAARDAPNNTRAPLILPNVPPKYSNTTSRGSILAEKMRIKLAACLNEAISRTYTRRPIMNRIYNTRAGQLMFPFAVRDDVYDLCMHGEPDGTSVPRYSTKVHLPEAEAFQLLLTTWAQLLAQLPDRAPGIDNAVKSMLDNRTHVRDSMAIMTAALTIGSQNRELLPFQTGFRDAGGSQWDIITNPVDVVELPFGGWLSFFLNGISSSLVESNGLYLKYADYVMPKMPSMYPLYIGMERCIVHDVVTGIEQDESDLEVRREEVIDLILLIMKRYWVTLDPDSPDRVRNLLNHADAGTHLPGFPNTPATPRAIAPLKLPTYFKMPIVTRPRAPGQDIIEYANNPPSIYGALTEQDTRRGFPLGRYAPPFTLAPKGVAMALETAKHCQVKKFYITRRPISPMLVTQYDGTKVFLYTSEENPMPVVKLEDLIRHRPDGKQSWTETELRAMADRYSLDGMLSGDDGEIVEWEAIEVSNVLTSFKFEEHNATDDRLVFDKVGMTIKRDRERFRDNKFEVSDIPVSMHVIGDMTSVRGYTPEEERRIMRSLVRYTLVPWETIRGSLMHFDGVNVDDVNLYDHDMRGVGDELKKDLISNVRVRDARHGITLAASIRLSTRKVEKFDVLDTLVKRTVPGTI